MHYFIDGYNLLFRLIKASDEDLQMQRDKIIEELGEKINLLNIDATIVFDSYYQKGLRERSHKQNFEVLFTDEGETADECILDELKTRKNVRQEVVVTSDKKLAWQARIKGAQTQTVEEFFSFLKQKWRKKVHSPRKQEPSPPPIPMPVEKPETIEEFYLRSFEDALAEVPFYKKEQEKKIKRQTDFERWLEAFDEKND